MDEAQRFWIDEEPWEFRGLRRKHLEGLKRVLEAGVPRVTMNINVPYIGQQGMEVLSVECDGDPDYDGWLIGARIGREARDVRIEWDPETEMAMLEGGLYLDEYLEDFARDCELLPPVNRSVKGTEVVELAELNVKRFFSLAYKLTYVSYESGQLSYYVAIYGDGLDEILRVGLPSISSLGRMYPVELSGHDADRTQVTKFVYPDLTEDEMRALAQDVTAIPTAAIDVTVFWPYGAIQAS